MSDIETTVTGQMLRLMHHALGLRPGRRDPFRNHYVAGPGHDELPSLESLVQSGLMKKARTPAFCDQSDIVFVCTGAGKEYAIANLPPEPKRTKYEEYMHADRFDSFAEFLGINKPEFDFRRSRGGRTEYRMLRRDRSFYQINGTVSGEWKPTKKEAKASYKDALKSLKGRAP